MTTYTTKAGDLWDSIAFQTMGSTRYTGALMRLNRAYLHYYIFPAGIVLTLPEETTARSESLPPWKGVAG